MKKFSLLFSFIILISNLAFSQASIFGKITNPEGEPVIYANIRILHDGNFITGIASDFDGNYTLDSLEKGKYTIEITHLEFTTKIIESVKLKTGQRLELNIELEASDGLLLDCIVVKSHCTKLISPDNTSQGSKVTSREIKNLAVKDINGVTNSASISNQNVTNIRGKRSKGTIYIVDGIKSRNMPYESYKKIDQNTFKKPMDTPYSTFSIDVDNAAYTNIRRMLNQNIVPPIDAVRIEEMINYFNYNYTEPEGENPIAVDYELAKNPYNENLILQVKMKAKEIKKTEAPAQNITFLLDVSGSMGSADKLPLLKEAMKILVAQLRPIDRVAIVVYAGHSGLVLESTPGNEKGKIIKALDQLNSGGSTAGGAGIELAYKVAKQNFIKNGNNRVILATDGDFNVGVSHDSELENLIVAKRETGIYLTTLGFGQGNIKDHKMELLANKGNGNYYYIDTEKEAKRIFVEKFAGTMYVMAKDVKLQIEFNPKYVKSYRLLGYENRALADEDFKDDKKDAGEIGAGHTVTAIYEIIPTRKGKKSKKDISPLKYQVDEAKLSDLGKNSEQLATINYRYKLPKKSKSKLQSVVVNWTDLKSKPSNDLLLSTSIARWGQVLRKDKHATYKDLDLIAQNIETLIPAYKNNDLLETYELVKISKKILAEYNTDIGNVEEKDIFEGLTGTEANK